MHDQAIAALRRQMPAALRYAGEVAKELRKHDVAVEGKESGNANTDALTLADLSLQAMLVAALRDCGPAVTACRIEAEEQTGPLHAFAADAPLTLALDPIDGTRQFRDGTGAGWSVMLHARTATRVVYSLVFLPQAGEHGQWVELSGDEVVVCDEDPARPAADVLAAAPRLTDATRPRGRGCYIIGFQALDEERAALLTSRGFEGHGPQQMPSSVYPLMASGRFCGSLIHTPNVYDFPVSLQIAERFGGGACRVDTRQPVDFTDTWLDERSGMLRLHGIVACADNPADLDTLCEIGKDWNPERYSEGM